MVKVPTAGWAESVNPTLRVVVAAPTRSTDAGETEVAPPTTTGAAADRLALPKTRLRTSAKDNLDMIGSADPTKDELMTHLAPRPMCASYVYIDSLIV